MKYFILYILNENYPISEIYLKGKSYKHVAGRVEYYSTGYLKTSKLGICTGNCEVGYLREIDLKAHPNLTKRDFHTINENGSYSNSELKDN